MSEISTEWKELLPKIGNLINHINIENHNINVKLKELQTESQAQIDEAYNKGIHDLYDAICCLFARYGEVPPMPVSEMRKLFGTVYADKIIRYKSPEEIIDKVNQWKAEKDKEEQELHVGDEVTTGNDHTGIIIDVGDGNDIVWIAYRIMPGARGLDICLVNSAKCKKTGRHFDNIPFDYNPEKRN